MPVTVKDIDAFLVPVGLVGGATSRQERSEGPGDTCQRRVLGLVGIDALVQPLHAGGNVARFVGGVIEDRVSSGDAQRGKREQAHKGKRWMFLIHAVADYGAGRWQLPEVRRFLPNFLLYSHLRLGKKVVLPAFHARGEIGRTGPHLSPE